MGSSSREITKNRKRAPKAGLPVLVRLQDDILKDLDEIAAGFQDNPGRAETIRRVITGWRSIMRYAAVGHALDADKKKG